MGQITIFQMFIITSTHPILQKDDLLPCYNSEESIFYIVKTTNVNKNSSIYHFIMPLPPPPTTHQGIQPDY